MNYDHMMIAWPTEDEAVMPSSDEQALSAQAPSGVGPADCSEATTSESK
ncbi:hypothetical protein [Bradyrhizobium sp. SZCCHNR2035]|nr:hypothetical protein [Bradyrhizobium sp. SZCCHNR2035]